MGSLVNHNSEVIFDDCEQRFLVLDYYEQYT